MAIDIATLTLRAARDYALISPVGRFLARIYYWL